MTNIAKLLKDAPKGTVLYSPLFGEVKFKYINDSKFGIVVEDSEGCCRSFDKYGRYFTAYNNAECLLFPSKDCRTWEGWKLPSEPKFKVGDWLYHNTYGVHPILVKDYSERQGYNVECIETSYYLQKGIVENEYHFWTIEDAKDGDVLVTDNGWTCIFKAFDGYVFSSYCFMDSQRWFCEFGSEAHTPDSRINGNIHPATKVQRDLLFAKIKEAGYTWDSEKKELKKIQPHYDISNFQPFDKVLVRDSDIDFWDVDLFSRYFDEFQCFRGSWEQCIPYNDDTKHLLGTTDMPSEEYINW